MILVISSADDDHAAAVLRRIGDRGILLDLAEFPIRSRLSVSYEGDSAPSFRYLPADGRETRLEDCRVAWWRRPQPYTIDPAIRRDTHRNFAYNETHEAVSGLWLALDAFWINHPGREEMAARKVYQLLAARRAGLEIPATLVTNNPAEARAFIHARGGERTVYKAFSATERDWRETRVVRPEETALLDSVRFAPVIFQEYIPAGLDLRVTVIDGAIFAAAVDSQTTAYAVDYRMDMNNAAVESIRLPDDVETGLRTFMERLGLVYGAIDMRMTPEGRFVFLEVNPSGQWLFIEERTRQPITEALVSLMIRRDDAGVTR